MLAAWFFVGTSQADQNYVFSDQAGLPGSIEVTGAPYACGATASQNALTVSYRATSTQGTFCFTPDTPETLRSRFLDSTQHPVASAYLFLGNDFKQQLVVFKTADPAPVFQNPDDPATKFCAADDAGYLVLYLPAIVDAPLLFCVKVAPPPAKI